MGNIALNRPTAASSYVLPYSASRAVDGSTAPTNRWLCNTLPGWMSVDLGAPIWVNQWIVRHMPVVQGWAAPGYVNSDFKLQGSIDNKTWYDIDIVTGNVSSITNRYINAVNARYFRVYVTKGLNTNPQLTSIMEFELYPAPPTSPYLSNLALSAGTLTPTFNRTTYAYTATVGYNVTGITLTPTAEDANATIKVNGVVVRSTTASQVIPLNVGANTIAVVVTSQIGGLISTYTVTVTRQDSAYLSNLTAQSGTTNIPLNPTPFVKTTMSYNASVGYNTDTITITPTAESSSAAITVNGTPVSSGSPSGPISLAVGDNIIAVVVAAGGGVSQGYSVKITRASMPYLSALTANSGSTPIALSPSPFVKTTLEYTATVGYEVGSATVTPTAEKTSATITVKGIPVNSGQASAPITLNIGTNEIPVAVTDGGVTTNYKITITRLNTSLSDLIFKGMPGNAAMTLAPGFQSTIFAYTTSTSKGKVTVTPSTPATGSVIKVNGSIVASGGTSAQITLVGSTTIPVTVTIDSTTTTYTIIVN